MLEITSIYANVPFLGRFKTKLIVTMSDRWYSCLFEAEKVCFSDVMIHIGKQAKKNPRHLFRRVLYCCGCGRRLSKEEESNQTIPAECCSVRSLTLAEHRTKGENVCVMCFIVTSEPMYCGLLFKSSWCSRLEICFFYAWTLCVCFFFHSTQKVTKTTMTVC